MNTAPDRSLGLRLAYVGTLAAWAVASFLPNTRLWGLGFLAPLGMPERLVVFFAALTLGVLIERRAARGWDTDVTGAPWAWWAAPAVAAALFVWMHDATHFLGDGAGRLNALAHARLRGGLEFNLTLPVLQAAGSLWDERVAALRAYQVVSIAAGVICVAVGLYYARRIFGAGIRAWAYAAGGLTAGYMLVFFGYVENHALLILAVFAFTSAGVALSRKQAGFGAVILTFALAVCFDALGWSLLPALLYLVVKHSRVWPHWRKLPLWTRYGIGLALAAVAVTGIQRLYAESYAFQIAILPLFKNRLTVDGYTLVSAVHLLDLVNLLFLLFPGLALALVYLTRSDSARERDPATTFLGWLSVSTWLVVSVLEVPLGMPRNWDRLALAGVPLVAWAYYRILSVETPRAITTALLCIALSWCALLSRGWVQARPEPSVKLAMSYFSLDPGRSRTGTQSVARYLLDHNLTSAYAELEDFRKEHYPEEGLRERLNALFRDNKQLEAADVCQRIIKLDPRFASAWMFLGFIYNNAGHFDSAAAYLAVAQGLHPHDPMVLNELGRALYYSGQRERAVELWHESLAEDSLQYVPHLALATWNKDRGNRAESARQLVLATSKPGAPGEAFIELARDHAEQGRMSEAREAYEDAMARGADSTKAALLLQNYPELAPPVSTAPPTPPLP